MPPGRGGRRPNSGRKPGRSPVAIASIGCPSCGRSLQRNVQRANRLCLRCSLGMKPLAPSLYPRPPPPALPGYLLARWIQWELPVPLHSSGGAR